MATVDERDRIIEVNRQYLADPGVQRSWQDDLPGNRMIMQERRRAMQGMLAAAGLLPLARKRVLEIGCGSGKILREMEDLGCQAAGLYGLDLVPERVVEARRKYPAYNLTVGDGQHLEFPDAHFHLLILFTVISSVLSNEMALNIAREADRVLQPGGAVLWYDMRFGNPRNQNVRGVRAAAVRRFFPTYRMELRTITPIPPLARRLGRLSRMLYPVLAKVPFLRTHILGLLHKPASSTALAKGGL